MDPLRPVKHDCNEFSTVKYVPIRWDYNVLTLISMSDAIENTALGCCAASGSIFYGITQAKKRKIPVHTGLTLLRCSYILNTMFPSQMKHTHSQLASLQLTAKWVYWKVFWVTPIGLEPTTFGFPVQCSNQLSYSTLGNYCIQLGGILTYICESTHAGYMAH